MKNHSLYLTFDADNNFVDYLIDEVIDTTQRWPEDYTSSDFNENWVESFIFKNNIWDEGWTCLNKEQQSELMDYVVSYVSEYFETSSSF